MNRDLFKMSNVVRKFKIILFKRRKKKYMHP